MSTFHEPSTLLILIEPRAPSHPLIAFSSHMTSVASKVLLSKMSSSCTYTSKFQNQKGQPTFKTIMFPIIVAFERHLKFNSAVQLIRHLAQLSDLTKSG